MIAFAYYRLPYLHHATYMAQHEGEPEVLSSVAELNGKEGFVIAPFAPSGECPVVLMHPDESKLISAEGAENASRRGTSYVATQQNLRRDVASLRRDVILRPTPGSLNAFTSSSLKVNSAR